MSARSKWPVCLVLLLTVSVAKGQNSGVAFLKLGVDAQAVSMGSGFASAADGAFATYWNPAGLALAEKNSVGISQHLWVGDVRTYAGAGRFRVSETSGMGVFITATGSGELEARSAPGEASGLFSAQFATFGASYGKAIGPLSVGITGKYIREQIDAFRAGGYALDAGLQLRVAGGDVLVGGAVRHLGKMNELNLEATTLPTTIQGGFTIYPFRMFTYLDGKSLLNTTLTAEVSQNTADDIMQVHVGASTEVLDLLTLRGGYITNDELRALSLGAGIHVETIRFDYAFLPFREGVGTSGHILSLLYSW